MKILLMIPKVIYESWPFPTDFWRCLKKVAGVTLPQLAAAIPGQQCDIFDGNVEKTSLKQYAKMLSRFDVVALSVVSSAVALNTEVTVKLIKAISPDTSIILGGHHATFYDKQWIDKGADVVIRREGEETFKEVVGVLEKGGDLAGITGITFRNNNGIIVNPDRDFIFNLDSLPFPAWEKIEFSKYRLNLGGKGIGAAVETSRGCGYRCAFCCASSMWKHSQRYKSVGRVLEEFRYLYRKGVDNIAIGDDNFGSNYERDIKILEGIVKENMKLHLWMFCRVDSVLTHPDFIHLAMKAGLKEVIVGYESLNQETLDRYSKGLKREITVKNFEDAYNLLRRHGVLVFGAFVGEILSSAKADNSIKTGPVCDVAMYQDLIPMRGIEDYERLEEKELIAVNSFYYDRYIPSYNKRKGFKTVLVALRQLSSLVNPHIFKVLFLCNTRNQKVLLGVYYVLFKKFFSLSVRKLVNSLICVFPWGSLGSRQNRIVSRYTNNRYINSLLKK